MKIQIFSLSLCLCFFFSNTSFSKEVFVKYKPHVVTDFGNGKHLKSRLGNQLLTFFRAYLVAKQNKGTLIFTPIDVDIRKAVEAHIPLIDVDEFVTISQRLQSEKKEISLITIPLTFDESALKSNNFSYVRQDLREILLSSVPSFQNPEKAPNTLNVAIHIRNGFGFDNPLGSMQFYDKQLLLEQKKLPSLPNILPRGQYFLDIQRPLKAPPLQYYVDALNYFNAKVPEKKTFFIFTDHPDKQYIINQLNSKLHPKIDFKILNTQAESENIHDLKDILLMSAMDALIRPGQSTFSLAAEALANYKYVVGPSNPKWIGSCLIMDRIYLYKKAGYSFCRPYSFLDE